MDVTTAWIILVSTCLSIGFSLFLAKRQSSGLELTFKDLDQKLTQVFTDLQKEFDKVLEPIIHTNSRVMGILGSQSADVRQIKAMDKAISQDIMDQMPLELALLEEAFPNLAEKLRDNPQLLQEAIPRIQKLLGGQEGNPLSGMTSRFKARFPEE